MCPAWEEKYPLTILQAFAREISDHTPLFLDTGEALKHKYIFRYENAWLLREGFRELVYNTWNERYFGDILDRWQSRLRRLRKKAKGWNRNIDAWYRKIKMEIIKELDDLDKRAEIMGLSAVDRSEQKELRAQLKRVMMQEEMKWLQRYKDSEIKDGDRNTRFFHQSVLKRRKRTLLFPLRMKMMLYILSQVKLLTLL